MKTLQEAKRQAQLQHYGKSNIPPEPGIRRKRYPPLPVEEQVHPLVKARAKAREIGLSPPDPTEQPLDGFGEEGNRGSVYFFNAQMAPWIENGHDHKIHKRIIELIRIHGHAHVENLINKSSLKLAIMQVVGDLFYVTA